MSSRISQYEWRKRSTDAFNKACFHYIYNNDILMWEYLLWYAEATWEMDNYKYRESPRSNRQKEQQKLAGQLRSITGMIGLAKHLRYTGNGMIFFHLDRVQNDLREVEKNLRHLLSNIKERIPA